KGTYYEIRTYPVNRGRKTVGVIHYFHDFSKRKQIEQRLRQSLLRLEKLNDLSRLLAMWLGKGNLMQVTLQTATELLEAVFGALFFLESSGLRIRALSGIRNQDESPALAALLEEAGFAAITDAQTMRLVRGPYNVLAVPLNAEILHGQPGALVFVTPKESVFSDFEISLAESVARQLAVTTENARLYREVERMAQIDGLTGIYTRRHFESIARHQWYFSLRHRRPFCVIMADIDFFKKVNDTHGHAAGDAVLRQVAERLRVNLREADVLGRYGGEEFIVLLPQTGLEHAREIAERIRAAVAGRPMTISSGDLAVTVSFGVAHYRPGKDESLLAVIKRADSALYEAKEKSRNRVCAQ
ncbi:MAG TPA: sensor domain-containing diguanylate cyclase, partial [Spirochaetia bacterium]|nr:sensor domain-containing diguanylate cyclase [Spirochaetia bacterium]